jgi:hypothetical protein
MIKLAFSCTLLAFSCVAPRCMGDIILLSATGGVSGSGDASATTDLTSQFQNFNFSDPESGSGSATASAQGTFSEEDASVQASVSQGYSVSDNNISISMQSSGSGTEQGVFAFPLYSASADANVTSDLSLEFELTNTYMVQLSGSMAMIINPLSGLSSGDQSAGLDGTFFTNDSNQMFAGIGGQFLLTPGIYTMSADSSWLAFAVGGPFNPHEFDTTAELSFNADFTPIVPEPQWSVLILALLVVVWHLIFLRRHRQG